MKNNRFGAIGAKYLCGRGKNRYSTEEGTEGGMTADLEWIHSQYLPLETDEQVPFIDMVDKDVERSVTSWKGVHYPGLRKSPGIISKV